MSPERLEPVLDRLEAQISGLREAVSRSSGQPSSAAGGSGAGSVWNGMAVGIALAGVVFGSVWIQSVSSEATAAVRQAEAYQKAVYMLAPRFAEEIEKELNRHKESTK